MIAAWLLALLCSFSLSGLPGGLCLDTAPEGETQTAPPDRNDYQIGKHAYPYDNLRELWPLIETVAANTGQPPEVVAGVISWETRARLKNGRSLRGGRDNRFWGPGQVGCSSGGYSWLPLIRKWMNAPRLYCQDLLDPYTGMMAAMLVLDHIRSETAFKRLYKKAKASKDQGLLLYLNKQVYKRMQNPGGFQPPTEYTGALETYDIKVSLEATLVMYSGGNLNYCEKRGWDCQYVVSVLRWVQATQALFIRS